MYSTKVGMLKDILSSAKENVTGEFVTTMLRKNRGSR